MHFTEEHLKILGEIQAEWNKAESDIKTAEMVVHKIVLPAVKELRYAGRRIIDALMIISANSEDPDHSKIRALLEDARFDCHRARHDAIDAATAKIAADIEIMVESLGYHSILPAYPDFPRLYHELQNIRTRIKDSRLNRDNRESIYSIIEASQFPILVQLFNDMRANEPMMLELAKKGRKDQFYGKWGLYFGGVGLVVGIFGILLGYLAPFH